MRLLLRLWHSAAAGVAAAAMAAPGHRPRPQQTEPPDWQDLTRWIVPPVPPPPSEDFGLPEPEGAAAGMADGRSPPAPASAPTLYRERNGWCPYSQRLWLALEVKGVRGYATALVEARGDTYDGVPTEAEESGEDGRPEFLEGLGLPQLGVPPGVPGLPPHGPLLRSGVGEEDSASLLRDLDGIFPESRPLWPPLDGEGRPTCEAGEVAAAIEAHGTAAAALRCGRGAESRAAGLFRPDEGFRLDPLPISALEVFLDSAESLLRGGDGPFFCGPFLSAADVVWAPVLERYAAQLPCLHRGFLPRGNRDRWPGLDRWYRAMDGVPAYACRVRGDGPSWRAVLYRDPWWPSPDIWHPRDTVGPKGELLASQDECTAALGGTGDEEVGKVWARYAADRPHIAPTPPREAAAALVRNRSGILTDSARWAEEGGRALCSAGELDVGLRALAWAIASGGDDIDDIGDADPSFDGLLNFSGTVLLAKYLCQRICVPRDMGAPAAAAIRNFAEELAQCARRSSLRSKGDG